MRKKPKEPFVPVDRRETLRQNIIHVLKGLTLSAREISGELRIPEKAVYSHLVHIRMSAHQKDFNLIITPAECRKCGFVFKKRERLEKPGKCPVCRGESIKAPLFTLR